MSDIVWTDPIVADLRQLWAQGHSTAEIGRRLNVSKNSIIGKAHRLDLDARPSPILRRVDRRGVDGSALVTDGHLPEIRRMLHLGHNSVYIAARLHVSLPSLRQVVAAHHWLSPHLPDITPPEPAVRVVCTAPQKPPEPTPAPAPRGKSERRCEWLDGDKPYTRCSEAHLPGRPYCERHAAIAYLHWRRRTAPAAAFA